MKRKVEKKKIDLGIEILRFLLSLWIVIIHCSSLKKNHQKYLLKGFHVPTFILLSFFFYYSVFSRRIISKIIVRFQRLLIPYILWPLLIILLNNFFLFAFSFGQYDKILALKDFYIQILMGAGFYLIFWFHFNLIFISLFFTIISFIFKKITLHILIFLSILSFYFHYSKLNFNFFTKFNKYYRFNMGSLIEVTPFSVFGCLFSSINILSEIKNYSLYSSIYFNFIFSFIMFILFKYDIFINHAGFRYPDILLNSFASNVLFLLFGSMRFDKIGNEKFIFFVRNLTKYTGGIYYLNRRDKNFKL